MVRAVDDVDVDLVVELGQRASRSDACRCSTTGRRHRTRSRRASAAARHVMAMIGPYRGDHDRRRRRTCRPRSAPRWSTSGCAAACAMRWSPRARGARRWRWRSRPNRHRAARRPRRAVGSVRRARDRPRLRRARRCCCARAARPRRTSIAAVVEAHLSGVPLLVLTADRPPELHGVGAPQTIEQTQLYGDAVRWFHDPGVPSTSSARPGDRWHRARGASDGRPARSGAPQPRVPRALGRRGCRVARPRCPRS